MGGMLSFSHPEGWGAKSCGVVLTRVLEVLTIRGGGGDKRFPTFKGGGGTSKVLPCLEGGGAKSFGPAIFPFCRPFLKIKLRHDLYLRHGAYRSENRLYRHDLGHSLNSTLDHFENDV